MELHHQGIRLIVALLAVVTAWAGARADTAPLVSERFTARHAPVPAIARLQVDPASGVPYHLWSFRTEVRNDHALPLRVVRFGFEPTGPDGLPLPGAGGRAFTAAEFTAWYTVGSQVHDGWLGPGQAAADTSNWNRSTQPVAPRGRWYYVAVDSSGVEYRAEAPVDLCPYASGDEPWSAVPDAARVPVMLDVALPAGIVPGASQLRFDRLAPDPLLPPPAVYSWDGTSAPHLEAAVPGLYRMLLYAAGCEPVTCVVMLTEAGGPLTLVARPAPLGVGSPAPELDSAHAWLADARSLTRRVDDVRARYVAAAQAYAVAHGDQEGFTFDWSPTQAEVGAAMAAGPHDDRRRFAAWVAATSLPIADAAAAAQIVELLPPSSPLWATGPDAALGAMFKCGALLGRDLVAALAAESPDHHVRAKAVAALAVAAWERGDAAALEPLRARLDGEFADVRSIDRQRARVATPAMVAVGLPAPAFRVRDLDSGEELTNADFAGRWLLVHFWATWCGFCKQEMPAVHAAVEAYGKRGLEIVSFSLDKDAAEIAKYRAGAWKLPWRQAWLPDGTADETARAFEVEGIPRLVLVDPEGKIVATDEALRGPDLDLTLAKWLGRD